MDPRRWSPDGYGKCMGVHSESGMAEIDKAAGKPDRAQELIRIHHIHLVVHNLYPSRTVGIRDDNLVV